MTRSTPTLRPLADARRADPAPGRAAPWRRRLLAFAAVLGPGLIVMVGDNDAGAFSTYGQAGQNTGTSLLWTLLLLAPVLYVNQEMALRLGAVTGIGHARLILARFGRFWGAFSVLDLFVLNALTIVTEFIGISLALDYFGISKPLGVIAAAALVLVAAAQGSFARFERFCLALCAGSCCLFPVLALLHPPLHATLAGFVPSIRARDPSDGILLVAAIVGTTIAPWQLFFQQSYVIDKGITARSIALERCDLALGIVVAIAGGVAIVLFTAAAFEGRPGFGAFSDAGAMATAIARAAGPWAGGCFAIALLDASILGAAAVSLSTAYAVGDLAGIDHSLHRSPAEAPWFFAVYGSLVAAAAAVVLVPGAPLGAITNGVQVLAGLLLPSATVFLLLLCNDTAVLGPWTNGRFVNAFTSGVVACLLALSVVLSLTAIFPALDGRAIAWTLGVGLALALAVAAIVARHGPRRARASAADRAAWRTPALDTLPPIALSRVDRGWLAAMRGYLVAAIALVVVRAILTAAGRP